MIGRSINRLKIYRKILYRLLHALSTVLNKNTADQIGSILATTYLRITCQLLKIVRVWQFTPLPKAY